MFRLLAQLAIYGTKASVERCSLSAAFSGWTVSQLGLKRRIPDVDSWCYESQWNQFRLDTLDVELRDFIASHAAIGEEITRNCSGIRHAFLTICPVEQSDEMHFACVLSRELLQQLSASGLSLQISPANVMPDVDYWTDTSPTDSP